jgi:predicted MFS family arabinose efflux permease
MKDKTVYLICLSVFPFMVCTGIIYSIISLYFQSLGAGKTQIGLLFTCGAAAGAITAPFLGQLSDKIGRRSVLLLAMALFALVFLGYALSRNYHHIFPVQVCEGMAWAALGASAMALIADFVPEERRGKAMGIYNSTWSLGWIIGPSLGGFLSDQIGFRLTFLICVFIITTGFAMGLFLLPKR